MKTEAKENKLYPRVTLDCRISCTHPFFRGDGYTAQVFVQLVTMQSYKAEKKRLNDKFNWVNLERTQVLTSISTLMGLTGFTKHRVTKAIEKLIRLQLISEEKCENIPGQHKNDGTVYTILRLAGSPRVPDTSAETKSDGINNSSSKTKSVSIELPGELDTPEFREAWGDFVVHRKQKDAKGKAMTERSAKMVLNKLVKANLTPGEAVAELNKAIECNWSSVFPKEPIAKVVKRTGKSSYKPAGPEALLARDKAANRRVA